MTLPIPPTAGSLDHIGDHEEIHRLLDRIETGATFLAQGLQAGNAADRPSASAANAGLWYWSVDTETLAYSDGSAWRDQIKESTTQTYSGNNELDGAHSFTTAGGLTITQEAKRFVGATDQPAFKNSWANNSASLSTLHFWQSSEGMTYVEGSVTGGSIGSTVFTLPVGYRPTGGGNVRSIGVYDGPGINTPAVALVEVSLLGTVRVNLSAGPVTGNVSISLNFRSS